MMYNQKGGRVENAGMENDRQHSRCGYSRIDNKGLKFGGLESDGLHQYRLTLCCLEYMYILLTASVLL